MVIKPIIRVYVPMIRIPDWRWDDHSPKQLLTLAQDELSEPDAVWHYTISTWRIRKPLPYQEGQSVDTRAELPREDAGCHSEGAQQGGWHIEKMMERCKKRWLLSSFLGVKHYPLVIAIIAIIAFLWESLFTNQYHGMG